MTHDKNFETQDKTTIFKMPSMDATMPDLIGNAQRKNPTLTIVKGPNTGMTFVLDEPEITIGRDPQNAIFLNDMTVSRRHATITNQADKSILEDLGSLNGSWVDGAIVNKAILEDGSTIQIGTFRMVYHSQENPQRINTKE